VTSDLAGQHIGVLGLARSGLAAARLALARGAQVYASDFGDGPALREAAAQVQELGGHAETGGHDVARLATCTRIVLSPGIPPSAAVLRDPALTTVPIISEIEFAWKLLDAPTIAITGTNGKSTVTALISHVLAEAGYDAPAGGNIGTALSDVALRDRSPDVAVVEVSSFQLARCYEFAPAIGLLTNLAPDHLDWYPGVEEYYADKARLFQNATRSSRWILNGEDERARTLPGAAPGERFYFRTESPLQPDERGGYRGADGRLVLRTEMGEDEALLPASELRILGPHNVANALAAAIAARLAGADAAAIAAGLRSFGALEHRLQPVVEREGVLWINDSKATNLTSTQVALRSMNRPTILLLGGRHKGEPYSALLPDMEGRVRHVVAFGEAGERIARDLEGRVPLDRVDGSLEEVVQRAGALARPGDAVLLSPACSSYDMFRNYEERGRCFAELAAGMQGGSV
jgi:UDP-N-acetylmuramoylalanine--D-glutamate ligase